MKKFWLENRDLIFGYASVFGTLLTLLATAYQILFRETPTTQSYIIVALCTLHILLVITCFSVIQRYFHIHKKFEPVNLENINLKAAQRTLSIVAHNVNHEARLVISVLESDINLAKIEHLSEREKRVEMYFLYLIDNIKEAFDVLTNDQCAVCIKIIVPNPRAEKQPFIKTQYRDSISYRQRQKTDVYYSQYLFYENTAFKKILDEYNNDTFYFCNDLDSEEGYNNLNQEWRKYYNACLVVPVSYPSKNRKTGNIVVGFICIDNFKGGFDDVVTRNFLSSIADINFLVYNTFDRYKEFVKSKTLKT